MVEGDQWRWVRVSTEMLAELGEWSQPLRVKIISETDRILDMIFAIPEDDR